MFNSMEKITKEHLNKMKRTVKNVTGYKMNKLEIVSYSEDVIVFNVYENLEHDKKFGIAPVILKGFVMGGLENRAFISK